MVSNLGRAKGNSLKINHVCAFRPYQPLRGLPKCLNPTKVRLSRIRIPITTPDKIAWLNSRMYHTIRLSAGYIVKQVNHRIKDGCEARRCLELVGGIYCRFCAFEVLHRAGDNGRPLGVGENGVGNQHRFVWPSSFKISENLAAYIYMYLH